MENAPTAQKQSTLIIGKLDEVTKLVNRTLDDLTCVNQDLHTPIPTEAIPEKIDVPQDGDFYNQCNARLEQILQIFDRVNSQVEHLKQF